MKKFIRLVFFFFIVISFSQNENIFKIDSIEITNKKYEVISLRKNESDILFEDDKYTISSFCHGEFGGVVIFKDKKTGFEYGCGATCAVIINKVKGKYIVTTSLAHMSGFTKIIEITNPKRLTILTKAAKKGDRNLKIYYLKKAKKGTKVLLNKYDILTLSSFEYRNKLYHITTDKEKTYVSEIINGEFQNHQKISSQRLWIYNANNFVKNKHHFFMFSNYNTKGYIDIIENNIKVFHVEK
jgi:transcriptional antiterminator Rof (Rho-off)